MNKTLDAFLVKPRNVYLTIHQTFERRCKECSELLGSEEKGMWVRVFCGAERCIKR